MPGPTLAKTFTYDGTPPATSKYTPTNTLPPFMKQTQRFFKSAQTGTHSREPYKHNIPNNSGQGQGAPSTHITHPEYTTE